MTLNIKNYKKEIILFLSVLLLIILFSIRVNADTLLTDSADFPVTQELLDMQKDPSFNSLYPNYFAFTDRLGDSYVLFCSNADFGTRSDHAITNLGNDSNAYCRMYKYNTSTCTYDEYLATGCSSSIYAVCGLDIDTYEYSNYDVKDYTGKVVFHTAPLRLPQTMVKGITAKEIVITLLSGIKLLIVSVVAFLVLAIAFRKGWTLLKKNLVRA